MATARRIEEPSSFDPPLASRGRKYTLELSGRAGTAKRIIFWFSPNGTVHRHGRPSGEGSSFELPPGSVLEPLAAHKSKLLVLDGLDFEHVRGGSHVRRHRTLP